MDEKTSNEIDAGKTWWVVVDFGGLRLNVVGSNRRGMVIQPMSTNEGSGRSIDLIIVCVG